MALKRLSTEVMVQLSSGWVEEGSPARDALRKVDELSGLLGRIEATHREIVDSQPEDEDPRLGVLSQQAAEVDFRHDSVVRGIDAYLAGTALMLGDDPRAGAITKLREVLLPDGLQAIQQTYRAEAGAAELLRDRLAKRPELGELLEQLPVMDAPLSQFVNEWLKCASELGALENERGTLVKSPVVSDSKRLMNARNQWIRLVNALVANAALCSLDEAADALIFGPLRLAEASADRRSAASASRAAKARSVVDSSDTPSTSLEREPS